MDYRASRASCLGVHYLVVDSYADLLPGIEGSVLHDEDALERALASLPAPRSPGIMLERLVALGVGTSDLVLDVGCGHGQHAREIAEATGATVLALDISRVSVAETLEAARPKSRGRVNAARAIAEHLPARNRSASAIWCRDMLYYVDLPAVMREFARVLRPGRHAIVYHTFATDQLEPGEARRLIEPFAIDAANMRPAHFEQSAVDAGFDIVERDEIGSEWREWWQADGSRRTSESLARAGKLVRGREAIVAQFGVDAWSFAMADQLWGIYQMIGKLCPTLYVLRR
jgi:ubiquinone/menaquinone biosynthesis C-methylase UbiE